VDRRDRHFYPPPYVGGYDSEPARQAGFVRQQRLDLLIG